MSSIKTAKMIEDYITGLSQFLDDTLRKDMPNAEFILVISSKNDYRNASYSSNVKNLAHLVNILQKAVNNLKEGNTIPVGSVGPVQ